MNFNLLPIIFIPGCYTRIKKNEETITGLCEDSFMVELKITDNDKFP